MTGVCSDSYSVRNLKQRIEYEKTITYLIEKSRKELCTEEWFQLLSR